jgi:hypothetical protein
MVTLTARCPYCDQPFRTPLEVGQALACPLCHKTLNRACPDWDEAGAGFSCLVCPSTELFVRKDFPQRWGVTIVVAGFVASSVAWYQHRVLLSFAVLFATALVDVILYLVMGNVLQCYRCHAQYRGLSSLQDHAGFNLEIHEKHRQQAARIRSAAASTPDQPPGTDANRAAPS